MSAAPESGPRIPLLPPEDWTDEAGQLLGGILPGGRSGATSNLMMTLAHDPTLVRFVVESVQRLLVRSSLPPRDRELVVLRATWRCAAAYAWAEHVRMAHDVGLDTDAVERVTAGPDAPGWSDVERALLLAVDQLHERAVIDDAPWSTLAGCYTTGQLLELPMLAGLYHLMSWLQNAAGIEPNPGSAGLAAR